MNNELTDTASYVYFLRSGECIKIGKANNIRKRLKTIQTSNPYRVELLTFVKCDSEDQAFELEAYFHEKFKEHRTNGEWFRLFIEDNDNSISTMFTERKTIDEALDFLVSKRKSIEEKLNFLKDYAAVASIFKQDVEKDKIVEDKQAYQSKRLNNIVIAVIKHIKSLPNESDTLVNDNAFRQLLHYIGTPDNLHTDDNDYLQTSFITNRLKAVYEKFGISTEGEPKTKVFSTNAINNNILVGDYVPLGEEVHTLILSNVLIQKRSSIKDVSTLALSSRIVDVLNHKTEVSGEELRKETYKNHNPEGYTKYFAKVSLTKVLDKMIAANEVECIAQGRKKTYKLKETK